MPKLRILLNSAMVTELNLEIGREYIAGRSNQCDLMLDSDKRISRQHFKIRHTGIGWIVEVLSRYGDLFANGEKIAGLDLQHESKFSVPPYEFEFVDEAHLPSVDPANQNKEIVHDFSDRTFVAAIATEVPFLKIYNEANELLKVFRLEGQSWIAGRDTGNSIFIDYVQMSRRHFEVQRFDGVFKVRDLESANGTMVNGLSLSPNEWLVLASGDAIQVSSWTMQFELRDTSFEDRVGQISEEMRAPALYVPEADPYLQPNYLPESYEVQNRISYGAMAVPAVLAVLNKGKRKNLVRMGIGLGLVVAILFALFPEENTSDPKKSGIDRMDPLTKLSKEQKEFVTDSYRLADKLFKDGKYELARQEIIKIHELVPYYMNSKELEGYCQVAIDAMNDRHKQEDLTAKMAETDEKIRKQAEHCKKKLNPSLEMQDLEQCLSSVLALGPNHPAIESLKASVENFSAQRLQNRQLQAERSVKVKRLQDLFRQATRTEQSGRYLDAISDYQRVINSNLPDPDELRPQAKRKIASIEQNLTNKQQDYEKQADASRKRGELKKAHQLLKQALEINPTNEAVRGQMTDISREIEKQMKAIWEESIIEEGVNEVEAAKLKWKKIVEQSIPEVKHYGLAKAKLKKYGFR